MSGGDESSAELARVQIAPVRLEGSNLTRSVDRHEPSFAWMTGRCAYRLAHVGPIRAAVDREFQEFHLPELHTRPVSLASVVDGGQLKPGIVTPLGGPTVPARPRSPVNAHGVKFDCGRAAMYVFGRVVCSQLRCS